MEGGARVSLPFTDRGQAGRLLAERLLGYAQRDDVVVLALPRGGVPVGFEIARRLDAPLDLLIVRKLGVPWSPELAMGAIASGGVRVLNADVVAALELDAATIEPVVEKERTEIERRERAYRGDRPRPELEGRIAILVDDGIATGSTMRAAAQALRTLRPARIVVATPVAPAEAARELSAVADEYVCLAEPGNFVAISTFYMSFPQTSDEEVRALLADAAREQGG